MPSTFHGIPWEAHATRARHTRTALFKRNSIDAFDDGVKGYVWEVRR